MNTQRCPNMPDHSLTQMAHLVRRAGFGALPEELDDRISKGYEETVEELLHPEAIKPVDQYELLRYQPWTWKPGTLSNPGPTSWVYRMINTKRPLEEKMTLFWHNVFATGVSKVDHWDEVADMIDLFRDKGLGSYQDLLGNVARNPAILFWLDNNQNHATAINENWGRELLELFSMGVGAYTEEDVKECSRAFTGWTISRKLPRFPYGRFDWSFEYLAEDHDDGEKTFLGETGRFNGDDIIEIICRQPATATFISRHLYSFFVADEVGVPAWSETPPIDPEAVKTLANVFMESNSDMRSVLRVLFNSDFFKRAHSSKVRSPAEVVVSTMKLVGGADFPVPGYGELARQSSYMGQDLLNPPSVEGWHSGEEWIDSGNLIERINFMTHMVGDLERPGVRQMVENLRSKGNLQPTEFVDATIHLIGSPRVGEESRKELVDHASKRGDLAWNEDATQRSLEMFKLVVSLKEHQLA